jgi:ethanolamine utilization protein EutQ
MPRQLFTAADIRRLGREQKSDLLFLSPDDLVTPEAVDVARELGIQLMREAPAEQFPAGSSPPAERSGIRRPLPPLKAVRGGGVVMDPFGVGLAAPEMNVRLKDVITAVDGSSMAAGYMALEKGEFPWTLTYDEVDVVLEGELVITRDGKSVRAGAGDTIFIPKGSSIKFGTPDYVRFIYVAFPANWDEQG